MFSLTDFFNQSKDYAMTIQDRNQEMVEGLPERCREESGSGDYPQQGVQEWQCPGMWSYTFFSENTVIQDVVGYHVVIYPEKVK